MTAIDHVIVEAARPKPIKIAAHRDTAMAMAMAMEDIATNEGPGLRQASRKVPEIPAKASRCFILRS
jgi:hypothetical protein